MEFKLEKGTAWLGKFGIEMEVISPIPASELAAEIDRDGLRCYHEAYNHEVKSHWKIVPDGSVLPNGTTARYPMELVSPPMEGERGIYQIMVICRTLARIGVTVNRTCGLHVHHEAPGFTTDKIQNMIKYYKKAEKVIDQMMPPSRRGNENRYCRSMNEIPDGHMPQSRYYKVNFDSLIRYGTVEFRQHAGTVDAEKIINWVKLTAIIMHRILNGGPVSGKPYERWSRMKYNLQIINKLDPETDKVSDFYYRRIKELAARTA